MSGMEDLTDEEIAEARHAFDLFDQDNDGTITAQELTLVLEALGEDASKAAVRDLINKVDLDSNGTIDFYELLSAMTRWKNDEASEDALRAAFDNSDTNGDGFIDADELYTLMIALGVDCTRADAERKLWEADTDGDGMVSCDEFTRIILS